MVWFGQLPIKSGAHIIHLLTQLGTTVEKEHLLTTKWNFVTSNNSIFVSPFLQEVGYIYGLQVQISKVWFIGQTSSLKVKWNKEASIADPSRAKATVFISTDSTEWASSSDVLHTGSWRLPFPFWWHKCKDRIDSSKTRKSDRARELQRKLRCFVKYLDVVQSSTVGLLIGMPLTIQNSAKVKLVEYQIVQ